jgi:hypothetical protein
MELPRRASINSGRYKIPAARGATGLRKREAHWVSARSARLGRTDSRQVLGTNKAELAQWVLDHGEDSDFVRVRVKGVFPQTGSM